MKKILKIISWILGGIIVLIIIAVVALHLFFPLEKVKTMALEKGSAFLGRDVKISNVNISYWGGVGIKLQNVSIGNPSTIKGDDFLDADNIDLKLHIFPLLTGKIKIDRLIINHPRITLIKQNVAINNYTFKKAEKKTIPPIAQKAPGEAKIAFAAVTFDNLQINHAYIKYVDKSTQKKIILKDFNLSTSLTKPNSLLYKSVGSITVESLLTSADMPLPPLSIVMEYSATYDLSTQSVSIDRAVMNINNLKLKLKGNLSQLTSKLKGSGNIKLEQAPLSKLLELVPKKYLKKLDDVKTNGKISLDMDFDYNATHKNPLTYFGTANVNSFKLSHRQIPGALQIDEALIDFKNDNLRFNIRKGQFNDKPIKGHLTVENFKDPTVNGEFGGSIDLAYIQPFLSDKYQQKISGATEFDLKVSGKIHDLKKINYSGSLLVKNGSYMSSFLPDSIEQFAVDMYFNNKMMNIKRFMAKTQTSNLVFVGRVNDLLPYLMSDSLSAQKIEPVIDGFLKGKANLVMFNSLLPKKGNPHLEGNIDFNLKITGSLKDYKKIKSTGTVAMKKVRYADSLLPEPITDFEMSMSIVPDTVHIKKMKAKFVSSDISLTGKLVNPFPYLLPIVSLSRQHLKKPLFLFSLTSHRFDVDKLFPEAVPASGTDISKDAIDTLSLPLVPDVDGMGSFNIDTLIYSKVPFTKIKGKVKIFNHKIDCYDVKGEVYSGTISGKTTIDLSDFKTPKYVGDFNASNIEANDFMRRFSKFGDHLYGKLNLKGTYNAKGWKEEDFINSLSMKSTSSMQQGELITSGVVYSTVSSLAKKMGQPFDKKQPLKDLNTNIIVKDGKVHVDKLKSRLGKVGDIELDGYYTFDGALNYHGSLLLSKEWSKNLLSQKGLLGNLSGFLTEKSIERIKLPLVIGGTTEKPSFAIDYSILTKKLGKDIKKDVGNFLNNLFKKKDKK